MAEALQWANIPPNTSKVVFSNTFTVELLCLNNRKKWHITKASKIHIHRASE